MKIAKTTLLGAFFLASCSSYGKKQPPVTGSGAGFAVVELFTSEGCSSCPSAEKVLAEIQNEYKQNVYILEFHVDYWNYIGWKDVFSSSDYTRRQQQYATQFHLGSTYTPQAIVNGAHELVGSDGDKLHSLINGGLQQKNAGSIMLSAMANEENVSITYTMKNRQQGDVLNIALLQKNAESDVKRGENSGRKLKHINVVRAFKAIESVQDKGTMTLTLPAGLKASDCIVIAYAQRKESGKIEAAVESSIN